MRQPRVVLAYSTAALALAAQWIAAKIVIVLGVRLAARPAAPAAARLAG